MLTKLLDGIVATNDGVWIDVEQLESKTVHVKGITTATLHICGSLDMTKPANGVHEIQIGDDITADTLMEVPAHLKWIKARCSAWGEGTISAFLGGKPIAAYK